MTDSTATQTTGAALISKGVRMPVHRWDTTAALANELGVSKSALLEVLATRARDEGVPDDLVKAARRIDAARRDRRPSRVA